MRTPMPKRTIYWQRYLSKICFSVSSLILTCTFYADHATHVIEDFAQCPATTANNTAVTTILRGGISSGSNTPITITRPGCYTLAGPLSATGLTTALTISADAVTLDLDGNTISGGATGINITGNNTIIKNGTICNTSNTGIRISGAQCQLEGLEVVNSGTGFFLENTSANLLTNCRALGCTSAGFSLVSSTTNTITQCQSLNTKSTTSNAYGFISEHGYGNEFIQCAAQGTQTAAATGTPFAAGFLFATEHASSISLCQADGSFGIASASTAYGIYLQNTQHCICTQNRLSNTHTNEGLGIGLRAHSTNNYITRNSAYNNDNNYQDIQDTYITSQANTRGVYNSDSNNTTHDVVEVINQQVITDVAQGWPLESSCELIDSKITTIATTIPQNFQTIKNKEDILDITIDAISPTIISAANAMTSKLDILNICNATPIITGNTTNSDKADIIGDITLSTSGFYCLSSNTNTGSITIAGSNITLDLNGHTLNCSGKSTGLTVSSTADEATIRNGTIQNATTQGISLNGNRCTLENIDVVSSPTGFYLNNTTDSCLINCRALSCFYNGFVLNNCSRSTCSACSVLNLGGNYWPVHGFYSTNGTSNIFDDCQITNASTTSTNSKAIARGFGFNNENYSTVANCTINGIRTAQSTATPSGIHAPLVKNQEITTINDASAFTRYGVAWLETNGRRFIAAGAPSASQFYILEYVGNSPLLARAATTGYNAATGVDWTLYNTKNYAALCTGDRVSSSGTSVYTYRFEEPNTITDGYGYIHQASATANIYCVNWLLTPDQKLYLAACGTVGTGSPDASGTATIRIHQRTANALTQVATYNIGSTTFSVAWLTLGSFNYLAAGITSTASPQIRLFQFNGSTLTQVTSANFVTGQSVLSLKWLKTSTGKYFLAASVKGTNKNVRILQLDPDALTLTEKASYTYSGTDVAVQSVSWLPGVDDLNYLALAGDYVAGISQVQVLRFDGSSLTNIFNYSTGTYSAYSCDWLTTGSTMLAVSCLDTAHPIRILGFSPTRNTFINNSISGVRGGSNATAFNIEGTNLILDNIATNNGTNYLYTPEYGDSNYGY